MEDRDPSTSPVEVIQAKDAYTLITAKVPIETEAKQVIVTHSTLQPVVIGSSLLHLCCGTCTSSGKLVLAFCASNVSIVSPPNDQIFEISVAKGKEALFLSYLAYSIIARILQNSLPLDADILVHESDAIFQRAFIDVFKSEGRSGVRFSSSNQEVNHINDIPSSTNDATTAQTVYGNSEHAGLHRLHSEWSKCSYQRLRSWCQMHQAFHS